jgi:hypothetical protein
MSEESRDYFEKRASEEREAADNADDRRAADSHRELARRYKKLADNGETRPRVEDENGDAAVLARGFKILP